jgi:hypothetical protein
VTTIYDKLHRHAEERERLVREEEDLKAEAAEELARVNAQIEELEARKEQLEAILGLDDGDQRAGHGQIQQLCFEALAQGGGPMTSGQVRDYLEERYPDVRLSSVPATLSRMASRGKLQRDDRGGYYMA